MSKGGRGKGKSSQRKKKTGVWQLLLAIIVVAGLASSWILVSRETSSNPSAVDATGDSVPSMVTPGLENRMVLPAKPQSPRPVTLSPAAFDDPEVKAAYQAAKDTPEPLENVACYCGCFGNSGHRNNLDCYKDNHGVTWQLCRSIALEAQRQYKMGTPMAQIKRSIDERWAPRIR